MIYRLLSDQQRHRAKQSIDSAPDGYFVRIDPPKRSLEQNAKMHAMLADIVKAKPQGRDHDAETWKCLLMDAVGRETGSKGFMPRWQPALDGNGVINTGYRSSRLTVQDMADFITFMQAWGDELGIPWSDRT